MGLWDVDKIEYVGRAKGPKENFAFHFYDADKVVAGKKMKDWLRFGVAWWHTFDQQLVDPFGTGTAQRPWYGKYSDPEDEALAKVDVRNLIDIPQTHGMLLCLVYLRKALFRSGLSARLGLHNKLNYLSLSIR